MNKIEINMLLDLFQKKHEGGKRPHGFNLQITLCKHLVSKKSLSLQML